jgi:hypothetical protein
MPVIEIALEERDYVNAVHAAARPGPRVIALFAGASACVAVAALFGVRAGHERQAIVVTCVWFFGLIGAWLGQRVSIATRARRVFQQQKALQRPYRVSWSVQGVTIASDEGLTSTDWCDFHRYIEREDQFLLFLSDALFLMFPKRAFPNTDSSRQFGELVRARVASR